MQSSGSLSNACLLCDLRLVTQPAWASVSVSTVGLAIPFLPEPLTFLEIGSLLMPGLCLQCFYPLSSFEKYLFIWLGWVLVAAHGSFKLRSKHARSLVAACGIKFPDQGLNSGPLHCWKSLQSPLLSQGAAAVHGSVHSSSPSTRSSWRPWLCLCSFQYPEGAQDCLALGIGSVPGG